VDRKLEEASLRAWPAIEQAPLDGWQLRYSHGFSKRANSVQPHAGSRASLEDKVARCEAWYAERGRPCIFRLTPFTDPTLDAFLAERGYAQIDRTAVLERATHPRDRLPDGVTMRETPLEAWLGEYGRMSQLGGAAPAALRGILETMKSERTLRVLWSEAENEAVACGIASRDGDLVGLFDLVTAPQHRRQGFGVALVNGLLAWGAARRASRAYLQVMRANLPAWGLYEKLGFTWVYDYWYRVREAKAG
jgi:ribosomal protein S18 acetylase RimI-like enzyme